MKGVAAAHTQSQDLLCLAISVVHIHLPFQDSLCHQLFSQVALKSLLAVGARHISVTRDSLLVERAQAMI